MTIAEMIEAIGFATIEVLFVTPAGRFHNRFDIDHISEDKDIFFLEDADGYPMELKKDSEVKLEDDGTYSINRGDCLICIKLGA